MALTNSFDDEVTNNGNSVDVDMFRSVTNTLVGLIQVNPLLSQLKELRTHLTS